MKERFLCIMLLVKKIAEKNHVRIVLVRQMQNGARVFQAGVRSGSRAGNAVAGGMSLGSPAAWWRMRRRGRLRESGVGRGAGAGKQAGIGFSGRRHGFGRGRFPDVRMCSACEEIPGLALRRQ